MDLKNVLIKKFSSIISSKAAKIAAIFAAFTYLVVSSYVIWSLNSNNKLLATHVADLDTSLAFSQTNLAYEKRKNIDLTDEVNALQSQFFGLKDKVTQFSGTVGTLVKLSQTDKELLQKYSKIYFLNENYIPSNLSGIESKYIYGKNKKLEFHTNALPFLKKMIENSNTSKNSLLAVSAYRSFDSQASLKYNYRVTYGSGANTFSADQGFSEHQLGTTVDLTTPDIGDDFSKFHKTSSYKWLSENAYKYGFILSYPNENKYYQFEPWHWRFVGLELAKKLHDEGKNFYDLDQREIDTYLVKIFDK